MDMLKTGWAVNIDGNWKLVAIGWDVYKYAWISMLASAFIGAAFGYLVGVPVGRLTTRRDFSKWRDENTNEAVALAEKRRQINEEIQNAEHTYRAGNAHMQQAELITEETNKRVATAMKQIAKMKNELKGGRERYILIRTESQRNALNRAKEVANGGSIIPPGKTFNQHAKSYDKATTRAGFNGHGLRHRYAQDRYRQLTGWDCPKAGGPKFNKLSPAQKETDRDARQTIAEELGHGRPEITNVYLGR
ncbi:MAG: hypothetical protein ACE5EN_01820 [Nitrospinota bacterium]